MHLRTVCSIATALLATAAKSAIVGAPTNVENPFAVELPAAEANNALLARDDDQFTCDGWCLGDMQCCLIAGIYSRCHSPHTSCSALSFPDALSAPGPQPPPGPMPTTSSSAGDSGAVDVTITTTLTRAATTVTLAVEPAVATALAGISAGVAAKGQLDGTTEGWRKQVVTEITTQVVSVPATVTVTAILSTISTPASLPTADGTTGNPVNVSDAQTSNCTSFPCSTSLGISSFALSYEPANSTSQAQTTSVMSETSHDVDENQQSTVTSVAATVASTTKTSVASLNGEPSAIASDLGQTGAAAAVAREFIGWRGNGGILVLGTLGVMGAVAVML